MWLNIYRCILLAAVIIEVSSGQSPHGGTRQFFERRGARSLERAKRSPAPFFNIFGNGFFRRSKTQVTPATYSFEPLPFHDTQNQLNSTQNEGPYYIRSTLNTRGFSIGAAIGARQYQRPTQFQEHPVNTPIQTNISIGDFGYTTERPQRPCVSYNNVMNWVNGMLWGTKTSSTCGTGKILRKGISSPTMWDNSARSWINKILYGPRDKPTLRPDQQWIQSTRTMRPGRNRPWPPLTTPKPDDGCVLPEQPIGGRYEVDQCIKPCSLVAGSIVSVGSILNYSCKERFTLEGSNATFCGVRNRWHTLPTCIKTCYALKSNSVDIVCRYNGKIVSCKSKIMPGTKATLACKESYEIPPDEDLGFREITCLEGGIWDRALFRCNPECGRRITRANISIHNRFTAIDVILPWHVVIYKAASTRRWTQICAGSLVSPNLVISAAHCFYDEAINETKHPSDFAVAAGKRNRLYNWPERFVQRSLVKRIDVPSGYHGSSENRANDIALVLLQTSFKLNAFVKPICIDWENRYQKEHLQAGRIGMTAGWSQDAQGHSSMELEEKNLINVPHQSCTSAVQEDHRNFLISNKFCAGYFDGSSLCHGDSGAGLDFESNGIWYLRGIMSVNPMSENMCDRGDYIPVINVGRYTDWIRDAFTFSA